LASTYLVLVLVVLVVPATIVTIIFIVVTTSQGAFAFTDVAVETVNRGKNVHKEGNGDTSLRRKCRLPRSMRERERVGRSAEKRAPARTLFVFIPMM